MQLRMLGGLELTPPARCSRKPLLLLAYLALEGRQSRRDLAELFWPEAREPLGSLSVALSTLRKLVGPELESSPDWVRTSIHTDVRQLLFALDSGDVDTAVSLYRGPLFAAVQSDGVSAELEDWLYRSRDALAGRLRLALIRQAELMAARGDYGEAAQLARQATGNDALAAPELQRIHRLLLAAGEDASVLAAEAAELGLPVSRTMAEARSQLAPAAPPVQPGAPRLFGRERELEEARRVLYGGEHRLLSIIGPGGIGKTSLAQWLAAEFRARQDVALVPLEAVSTVDLLPAAIGRATSGAAVSDWQSLQQRLSRSSLLLVLDGFEHLKADANLQQLLDACPDLRLLVTSRRQLEVSGQHVMRLKGLRAPVESLADSPAVRLFTSAARRGLPDFEASVATMAAIARIAELLDGSPLALQLAASWTRLLPVSTIADQIQADSHFLAESSTAARSDLQGLFESSWQLLEAVEQQLLLRLAVFRGGFTAQAAEEVAGGSRQLLGSLLAKSMLSVDADGRFSQHELLRSFISDRLAEDSESAEAAARQHAGWFLAQLRSARDSVSGIDSMTSRLLERDFRNLLRAWHFAAQDGLFELLHGCSLPLAAFCDRSARALEGRAALRLTLTSVPAGGRLHAEVALALAWLELRLGHIAEARQLLAAARPGVREARGALDAWDATVQATCSHRIGDYRAAEREFRRLLELAELDGEPARIAFAHGRLGVVLQALGDYDSARQHYQAALEGTRRLGDEAAQVTQLLNLGALEMNSSAPDRACLLLNEGLELARRAGRRQVVPVLLHNLANLASRKGDHEEAQRLIEEALELVRDSGEQTLETGMLATRSMISLQAGDGAAAERHALAAMSLATLIQDEPAALTALLRYAEWRLQSDPAASWLLRMLAEHPAAHAWVSRRASALLEGRTPQPPQQAGWPAEVLKLMTRTPDS